MAGASANYGNYAGPNRISRASLRRRQLGTEGAGHWLIRETGSESRVEREKKKGEKAEENRIPGLGWVVKTI